MKDDARRKLENQLIVMGLNRLTDPELVPQMAKLIPDGGTLAAMLNECDQEKRREMYYALRPYLPFKPMPLESYLDFFTRRAEAIESEHTPVQVGARVYDDEPVMMGGHKFREVRPEEAEGCLLKLTCCKCTKSESFMGLTPVEAITVARGEGWKRDLILQKEVCPKCSGFQRIRKKVL